MYSTLQLYSMYYTVLNSSIGRVQERKREKRVQRTSSVRRPSSTSSPSSSFSHLSSPVWSDSLHTHTHSESMTIRRTRRGCVSKRKRGAPKERRVLRLRGLLLLLDALAARLVAQRLVELVLEGRVRTHEYK